MATAKDALKALVDRFKRTQMVELEGAKNLRRMTEAAKKVSEEIKKEKERRP